MPTTKPDAGAAKQPAGKQPPGGFTFVPPPSTKKPRSAGADAALAALVKTKRFAGYRENLGAIKQAASRWSVDPVHLLLVLAATGRAATVDSIDQIGPVVREIPNYNSIVDWAAQNNISLSFRPGDVLSSVLKKAGYDPVYSAVSYGQTPAQAAGRGVETTAERADLTDPYVFIDENGKIVKTRDPGKAITLYKAPVRQSDFMRAMGHYDDLFRKYIGRPVKPFEVASILRKGITEYGVQSWLSKDKNFVRGQIWQAAAPSIIGYAKSLLGEGWKVDRGLVRQAIVQNWSEGTLRRRLMERPEYLNGPKFREDVAALTNVHQSIFGRPNEKDMVGIKEAALGAWSPDQYAAYLRNDARYVQSNEYKSKALSFLEALGLITGQQVTTQDIGQLGQPQPVGETPPLPDSPRIVSTARPQKVGVAEAPYRAPSTGRLGTGRPF